MRRQLVALAALGALGALSLRMAATSSEAQAAAVPAPLAALTGSDAAEVDAAEVDAGTVRLAADFRRERRRATEARLQRRRAAAGLPEDALRVALRADPEAMGSLSIGRANRGALYGAVRMPEGPLWHLAEPDKAWGTEETVRGLSHAIERVNEEFVASPPLWIGHISAHGGGWLRPHRSHQAGRDVDLGFYYADDSKWYSKGTAKNLDIPRNWVLLGSLLRETDVELIFLDRSIQSLLSDYARAIGEDPEWIEQTFEGPRRRSQCTIRHEWGHATHMHVRFASEVSRELGSRLHPLLVERGLMPRAGYRR